MNITKAHAQRLITLLDSKANIELAFYAVEGSTNEQAEAQLVDIVHAILCTTFGEEQQS